MRAISARPTSARSDSRTLRGSGAWSRAPRGRSSAPTLSSRRRPHPGAARCSERRRGRRSPRDQARGLAWVVGALVEIPIMWTFPRLSARFSAERLLVTGSAIFAARNLLAALSPNGAVLVAIAPLEGAAFGLFFVGGVGF